MMIIVVDKNLQTDHYFFLVRTNRPLLIIHQNPNHLKLWSHLFAITANFILLPFSVTFYTIIPKWLVQKYVFPLFYSNKLNLLNKRHNKTSLNYILDHRKIKSTYWLHVYHAWPIHINFFASLRHSSRLSSNNRLKRLIHMKGTLYISLFL